MVSFKHLCSEEQYYHRYITRNQTHCHNSSHPLQQQPKSHDLSGHGDGFDKRRGKEIKRQSFRREESKRHYLYAESAGQRRCDEPGLRLLLLPGTLLLHQPLHLRRLRQQPSSHPFLLRFTPSLFKPQRRRRWIGGDGRPA